MKVKMTQADKTGAPEFHDKFAGREPLDAPNEFAGRFP